MIVVTWGSATDTGRVRVRNEDSVLAQAPVFLVADGMGGHLGGEVASQITVDTFREILGRPTVAASDIPPLLQQANESIRLRARVDPGVSDMGTTAVGLAMVTEDGGDYWLAFNVGDSRIYRMQSGRLSQITVDHSYVQDLVAAGRIAPEEARTHPERNIVTRVLGVQDYPVPDFWVFPPEPGERFLICSDGLSGELDDGTIEHLMAIDAAPHEVARVLIEAANASGGRDNITVIVVDVAGADTGELDAVLDVPLAAPTQDLPAVDDDDAPTAPFQLPAYPPQPHRIPGYPSPDEQLPSPAQGAPALSDLYPPTPPGTPRQGQPPGPQAPRPQPDPHRSGGGPQNPPPGSQPPSQGTGGLPTRRGRRTLGRHADVRPEFGEQGDGPG